MPSSHLDTIRRHCLPLEPIPTKREAELKRLRDVQAVLFDVYGTLFISASGDVGTATDQRRGDAFHQALMAVGIPLLQTDDRPRDGQSPAGFLISSIREAHLEAQAHGIEFPEVDIVAIWDTTLHKLARHGFIQHVPPNLDAAKLALEYEVRTNPTWPMPGAAECLAQLRAQLRQLGIVSNAQFFTRELFPALMGQTPETLGFSTALQFYSYQWKQAKPGRFLYQLAADALSSLGVPARNVLYIGNDMLNDIAAAQEVGFRTGLFAGDLRSLRLRNDDSRVSQIQPDVTLTHLSQVIDCIE